MEKNLDKITLTNKTRESLFTILRHSITDLEKKKKGTYTQYGKGGSCLVSDIASKKKAKHALKFIERLIGECK